MGGCLSNRKGSPPPPSPSTTAKVISLQGHLREYPVPITVSRVLQTENSSSSTSDSFLCNSDLLYYDDLIPPLPLHHHLQPNQIYFLLPISNLHHRLTASQMAALAVKATLALQNSHNNHSLRRKKARISPSESETESFAETTSSSSSVKKILQRSASRRAKMAVRSFKLRLTTIYEGAVL